MHHTFTSIYISKLIAKHKNTFLSRRKNLNYTLYGTSDVHPMTLHTIRTQTDMLEWMQKEMGPCSLLSFDILALFLWRGVFTPDTQWETKWGNHVEDTFTLREMFSNEQDLSEKVMVIGVLGEVYVTKWSHFERDPCETNIYVPVDDIEKCIHLDETVWPLFVKLMARIHAKERKQMHANHVSFEQDGIMVNQGDYLILRHDRVYRMHKDAFEKTYIKHT